MAILRYHYPLHKLDKALISNAPLQDPQIPLDTLFIFELLTMKFSLALASLFVAGVAALPVREEVPPPSLEEGGKQFSITLSEEHNEYVTLHQRNPMAGKRRGLLRTGERRARNNSNSKSSTASPTVTPKAFFYAEGDAKIVTQALDDLAFAGVDVPEDCIGDACEGIFIATITGAPTGGSCFEVMVGVSSLLGGAVVTISCPEFNDIAEGMENSCMDTVPMLMDCPAGNRFTPRGSGVAYTLPVAGSRAMITVTCCPP